MKRLKKKVGLVKKVTDKTVDKITGKSEKAKKIKQEQQVWINDVLVETKLTSKVKDTLATITPLEHFEEELDEISDGEITVVEMLRDEAKKELDEKNKELDKLDPEKDEKKIEEIEEEIQEIQQALITAEERIESLTNENEQIALAKKKRDRLLEGTQRLSEETQAAEKELRKLRLELGEDVNDFSKSDKNEIDNFRNKYSAVSLKISSVRQDTFPVTHQGPKGPVTEQLPVLDTPELKLLTMMQEMALVLFQSGKTQEAYAKLEAVEKELLDIVARRTGFVQLEPKPEPPKYGRNNLQALDEADRAIERLRSANFTWAAFQLENLRMALEDACENEIKISKTLGEEMLDKKLKTPADELKQKSAKALETANKINKVVEDIVRDLGTIRGNGYDTEAQRLENRLKSLKLDQDLDLALRDAEQLAKEVFSELKETRAKELRKENVDPEELRQDMKGLLEDYKNLFERNDLTGKIVAIKDSGTGELKGKKKNAKLPREAIEELELRLRAAGQLAFSGSVDAAKLSVEYIDELKQFMKTLDTEPGVFEHLEKLIQKREKRLADIAKKWPLYEIPIRKGLEDEVKAVRDKYVVTLPAKTRKTLTGVEDEEGAKKAKDVGGIDKQIGQYEQLAMRLQAKKRRLAKQADATGKKIEWLGGMLKKHFSNLMCKFEGNHGTQAKQIEEILSLIARRTELSLNQAHDKWIALELEVDRLVKIMNEKFAEHKIRKDEVKSTVLEKGDYEALDAFIADARDGQLERNMHLQLKDRFEKLEKKLEKGSESLGKDMKKAKMDPSEADAILEQVKSLKSEMKASEKYADGVLKLDDLEVRYENLKTDYEVAQDITSCKKLVDAADKVKSRAEALQTYLGEFYAKKIVPAGVEKDTNQLDTIYKSEKKMIESFMDTLAKAIPASVLKSLHDEAIKVDDKKLDKSKRKLARKNALAAVRRMMAVLEGFPPMDHFRTQTFEKAGKEVSGLKQALPRLEIQLLTRI